MHSRAVDVHFDATSMPLYLLYRGLQAAYVACQQEVLAHFDDALLREWQAITQPHAYQRADEGARGERSRVLAVLLAKEVNEWGHLTTAVAGRSTELGWQPAQLDGTLASRSSCIIQA